MAFLFIAYGITRWCRGSEGGGVAGGPAYLATPLEAPQDRVRSKLSKFGTIHGHHLVNLHLAKEAVSSA